MLISSAEPLEIRWTAPAGSTASQRLLVTYHNIVGSVAAKRASLYCDYPLSQGTATIPASLLAELRSRVGAGAVGHFTVWAGERKVFSGSPQSATPISYIVDVTRPDSTTLHPDGNFIQADLE